jgi:predicted protein tyrosine phosphatase
VSRTEAPIEPDISRITDYLFISAFPEAEHAATIRALNVRLILSMPLQKPHHEVRMPPVKWLHLRTVDSPLTPMPISTLRRGVEAALPVIDGGHAVLVHCLAGVHRSVAMACCILIGMGYSAEAAMALVESKREVADPRVWYIRARIEKFERSWRKRYPIGEQAAQ